MKVWLKSMIILALVVGFSLVALGQYEGTTITVTSFVFPATDALAALIPEFEQETGIKVNFECFPYGETREKDLLDAATRRGDYDVMWMDTIWIPEFVKGDYLFPVTAWVERDWNELNMEDWEYSWDDGSRYQGEWWGLPAGMAHYGVMVYRKDLFEQYGITRVPSTWKEVKEVAEKLTVDTDGDGKTDVWGIAHRYQKGNQIVSDWFHYIGCYSLYESKWGSGLFFPNMKPAFHSPDLVKAANDFLGFYWEGLTPTGSEFFAFDDIMDAFKSGRVGMIITENWAISSIVDELGLDKVGFAPPPGYEYALGDIKRAAYAGGAFPYVISQFSRNKEAAWEFIKWANSIETAKKMTRVGGATNFRKSVFTDPALVAQYPWLPTVQLVAEAHFSRPLIPEYSGYEEITGLALSRALLKEITVEQALQAASDEMYDLLEKEGYYE